MTKEIETIIIKMNKYKCIACGGLCVLKVPSTSLHPELCPYETDLVKWEKVTND